MDFESLNALLALAPSPAQPGTQQNPTAELVRMLGMFALMGVMFYFLLIRPQQKKAKAHAELLKAVKPGDKILTTGGVLAVVITVKEKSVSIRSGDAKMEITKSAITEITERNGESKES